jgi:hypothetical protein
MNELRPLDIAHKFCCLLYFEKTGTRTELAIYLGITTVMVNTYKKKIERIYKVEIKYSRKRATYFVSDDDKAKLPPPYLEWL